MVNFRILPGDTGASVLQHVRDTVGPGIHVERKGRFSSEPSPESEADAPAFRLLQTTLVQTVPRVIVAPNLLSGGTERGGRVKEHGRTRTFHGPGTDFRVSSVRVRPWQVRVKSVFFKT